MPLDFLGEHLRDYGLRDESLQSVANKLGVVPISNDFLNAYKAEQVRKNPGSWLYRHHASLDLVMFYAFCGNAIAAVCFGVAMLVIDWTFGWAMGGALLLAITSVITADILNGRTVKGPAEWEETYGLFDDTPSEIASLARAFARGLPGSTILTGKLVQSEIHLDDPYVIVRHSGDQIVIGIWDSTGILHVAS